MLTNFEKMIFDQLEGEATKNGFEIVNVSVVGSKKAPILKVFIDTEGGVSFEELAKAQEFISPIIEEIDPFDAPYTLEVSSPGIDRPLVLLRHFEQFIGSQAHVRVQMPVEERRNFNGIIAAVEGNIVTIEDEEGQHSLNFDNIKRANLIGQI
ncbi:MAG: ribosome maturation factor RimP [Phoenicibacter congonensis]|uniref:Ribosome maturation factor RimP n=1 Tax=Phoenicibacter congonensis TaxID=1944646 RepID=A0AA43UB73_9ACTN|nr:ribosome maturation factor RimP [Phoenicibacter congonensis]